MSGIGWASLLIQNSTLFTSFIKTQKSIRKISKTHGEECGRQVQVGQSIISYTLPLGHWLLQWFRQ